MKVAHAPTGEPGQGSAAGVQNATLANDRNTHIWISRIDGHEDGISAHGHYRLQPGRHTIRVKYYWTRGNVAWTGDEFVDCSFDVKAGTSLRIQCEHSEEGTDIKKKEFKGTWKFWIEDASNRAVIVSEDPGAYAVKNATGELMDPYLLSGTW